MILRPPAVPPAPRAIQKGTPLKALLDQGAVECLAQNVLFVHPGFAARAFEEHALAGLDGLGLMQRGRRIAQALHQFLPGSYSEAVAILLASLTPARTDAEEFGLAELFHLPHSFFIADYGRDPAYNQGQDPFEASMRALYELTTRFTSEFAIREFLLEQPERTLEQIRAWLNDPNPHVRRLCSEGTRPRLPWGKRIPALVADPRPTLPILEALNNDPSLYVRRSVANHLGDIAKDHPELVFSICERWLGAGAPPEVKWVIRHALRHPAKKGNPWALEIRAAARDLMS